MRAGRAATDYTLGEEIASSVTHGVGILLSIAGLTVLVALAAVHGDPWHVISCSVFGATLILLYAASTLYHAIPPGTAKRVLRVLDHSAIYMLIAGTYTPFTLICLEGWWRWSMFGAIWTLAVLGIVLKATGMRRCRVLAMTLYVCMGWLAVLASAPLLQALPTSGMVFLVLGGVVYTAGIAFYSWKRLPYNHAIWHGFVLAGSVLHFFAVLRVVLVG